MGQKVHPIGFRIGVTEDVAIAMVRACRRPYAEFLIEDEKIRKLIDQQLNRTSPFAGCAGIEIERTRNEVKVVLATARPGMVIGPKGAEVDKLREKLEEMIDRKGQRQYQGDQKPRPEFAAHRVGCLRAARSGPAFGAS